VALTTSTTVGHNIDSTAPRPYRYKPVTATLNFIHLSTDIHITHGISQTKSGGTRRCTASHNPRTK